MEALEIVVQTNSLLGEGPSWDADHHRLLWVDIEGHLLHIYYPKIGENETYNIGQPIGAVVPYCEDEVVVALYDGIHKYRLSTGELTLIANPEQHLSNNRFNDGKCDPKGRLWVGTMSMNGQAEQGSLYCLDLDLSIRKVLENVSISNGLGWSPDYSTMYYIDTPTRQVDAFDYDLETGMISNRRLVITMPDDAGDPDGMTVDAEGMLWIAEWNGERVAQWNPNTGEKLSEIVIPSGHVTSCVFAGDDLQDLYISTARIGMDDEQMKEQPLSGNLFRIRTEMKGQPTFSFKKLII
ncbi:SMP-30/gluconolactonase/LRE family protein [Paenibacillus crassostreae]|uniref:Regucalcin n=1 Tax=Paenibacillus crassostreae TaxID=1763538 RepID=A0A167FQ60_9BACL|nr:SMP-30/gluconolactonase/LRE family protein [Paenibacillus crassostreae]AOZ94175.1 SMP-30/gluconolaconase/LRE domain protein [Paenibacillus crassostreae]OAB76789.1 SMP-30/gluconolaconase/LRE domain protein [Paenibacillus crassostreae]